MVERQQPEVRRVSAEEAGELCARGYVYVDVRSELEYQAGHPAGAQNVPFLHAGATGLVPNPDFLDVMTALYPKDARLVLGCSAGKRSLAAAEALMAAGWTELVELRPGFGGARSPFGQVTEPGWAGAGLSTELVTDGGSYRELQQLAAAARDRPMGDPSPS